MVERDVVERDTMVSTRFFLHTLTSLLFAYLIIVDSCSFVTVKVEMYTKVSRYRCEDMQTTRRVL